jgi:2,4'-dihydroxyacetophenone dioxygenase
MAIKFDCVNAPYSTDDTILLVIANGDLQLLDAEDRIIGIENRRSATARYLTCCQANDIEPRDLSRRLKARPAAQSTTH